MFSNPTQNISVHACAVLSNFKCNDSNYIQDWSRHAVLVYTSWVLLNFGRCVATLAYQVPSQNWNVWGLLLCLYFRLLLWHIWKSVLHSEANKTEANFHACIFLVLKSFTVLDSNQFCYTHPFCFTPFEFQSSKSYFTVGFPSHNVRLRSSSASLWRDDISFWLTGPWHTIKIIWVVCINLDHVN